MVEKQLPNIPVDKVHGALNQGALRALYHPSVETICQTAVTGDVPTDIADQELIHQHLPISTPMPDKESRVVKVMGPQTEQSWRELLKSVCRDECQELVNLMRASSDGIAAGVAVMGRSIPAACASGVVSKVEAEILGCCARSCGYDGNTCRYWPFLTKEEQDGWNARCCSENTILQHSNREIMCNSVKPKEQRQALQDGDPAQKEDPIDAQLVDQNFKASLLQAAALREKALSGTTGCSHLTKKCPPQDEALHLAHCKSQEGGQWNYMLSRPHVSLNTLCRSTSEAKVPPHICLQKLGNSNVRSVSWHQGNCFEVLTSCQAAAGFDGSITPDFQDAGQVVLFKKR